MNKLKLAVRMLWRDKRSGELTILFLALLIAVSGSTAISLFADRLDRTMTEQTAEFLAADMVISSHSLIPQTWLDKAKQLNLAQAQTAEFSSVLMENDELLLAGVKAVSPAYPLRGYLKTATTDYATLTIEHHGPEPGTVWVENRILTALKLQLGDTITVGEKPLLINKVLAYEPDKQGDFYSFSPRVLMSQQDLEATGIIQPGSHVHYFFQFSGDREPLIEFKNWLKPQLNLAQRIMDVHEDRPEVGSALNRAERYLGLCSIVVIIISGVAIAMAARRYSERHLDATALLRCLGCKQSDILTLYFSQFVILGLSASLLGCGFGWMLQEVLFKLLRNLLPPNVANPGWLAVVIGVMTGMTVLIGFALPPLLRLKRVSPARVLRRDLTPMPASAWLVYGLSAILIGILIWRYTEDFKMTLILFGAGAAMLAALGFMVYLVLVMLGRCLSSTSLNWRFGLQGLTRHRQSAITQILAFSVTLVAMSLSYVVRSDLLENWRQQLPEHAPNHFALNIFPDQLSQIQQEFQAEGIEGSRFYPIVRGRLIEINAVPVQKVVSKDTQGENATHRELSLTWSENLPDDNKVITGSWWTARQQGLVSVEQKLAESLKIKVGDHLLFIVGGQRLEAKVSNIRSLHWDTMKPNFYMIFSPGSLNSYPSTYLTSFYLPEQKKTYLNRLVKTYPSITVLDVEIIMRQIKTVISQLTQAINYLLYFALLAGFTVLFSAIYASLDNRIYESALLRTFGAKRAVLRKMHLMEFTLLGLVSGLTGVIITEGLLYALYTRVIHMDYHPAWRLWLVLPVLGALTVGLAGAWGLRKVVNIPPLRVLRDS
jgi:putative ABC transport system permease protein